MTADEKIDTFFCVHRRDIDYLLETSLRAVLRHFKPRGSTTLVTNDVPALRRAVERWGLDDAVGITDDSDWLSEAEMLLPGWYKQQVIKLRAHEFCTTENFCNIGADTILMQPVLADDVLSNGRPVVYYTRHAPRDVHWLYERVRVHHAARILRVRPRRAAKYVDFINDVFCFNRSDLVDLNSRLTTLYGSDPYHALLKDFHDKPRNEKKFGEWTLYNTFVLDGLNAPVELRNMSEGFLTQVRSQRALDAFDFNTKAAHFVSKDFDVESLTARLAGSPRGETR